MFKELIMFEQIENNQFKNADTELKCLTLTEKHECVLIDSKIIGVAALPWNSVSHSSELYHPHYDDVLPRGSSPSLLTPPSRQN